MISGACKGSKEAQEAEPTIEKPNALDTSMPDGNQFLFWQIRHADIEKPSYLYGTIHVIGAEDFFLGENVQNTLSSADKLIMEIDFDEMDMSALATAGLLPDGKSMRDYLSEEDYDVVAQMLSDSIGLSPMAFEGAYSRMKPLFLEQLVIYKFLGGNPMSYENEFNFIAEREGIESEGLESFEGQLAFLDQIPLDEQYADLLYSIKNWGETRSQFQKMLDAYKAQDLNALNRLIEVEMENPKMKELLLDRRNKEWIPKLSNSINEGNAFIAVGAGHLSGGYGLIQLLRHEGYEVWPYPPGDNTY